MAAVIETCVRDLKLGAGETFENMTLFPILPTAVSGLKYSLLAEALSEGAVEVREKSTASVPELWLINHSETMVLVMGGEGVVGGKQNRMVNASFLIPARGELALPVTCVEHGRWHRVSDRFRAGEAVYASLRHQTNRQVTQGLRTSGRHSADQGAVWQSIEDRSAMLGAASPTAAMHDIYQQKQATLADYERAFPVVTEAVGMMVALGGRLMGADVFDQPPTAGKLWEKLVRSYALDALDIPKGESVTDKQAGALLSALAGGQAERYPSLGLGYDLRLAGTGVEGSALVFEETVVHLVAYPTDESQPTQAAHQVVTRIARASDRQRR